jgi:hypothetical protein
LQQLITAHLGFIKEATETLESDMHEHTKSISWRGDSFLFQRLVSDRPDIDTALWAVFRHREFIGTMFCPTDVTTREFEVRGRSWVQDLLIESTPAAQG